MFVPDRSAQLAFVEQWIRHAVEDVRVASACVRLDPPIFGSATYHCQQAAEKLLKGALVLAGVDFQKTYNLELLGDLVLAAFPNLQAFMIGVTELTSWGISYRYPGEAEGDPERSTTEIGDALHAIAALTEAVQTLVRQTRDGSATT